MRNPGEDLEREIIQTITALLDQLGAPAEVHHEDKLGDLGLDSLAGVEFVCQIEEKLGITIPNDENPFVDDSKQRLRTVAEVIDFVRKLTY